jgi:hypothetical protein
MTVSREEFEALLVALTTMQARLSSAEARLKSQEDFLEQVVEAIIGAPPTGPILGYLRRKAQQEMRDDCLHGAALRLLGQ